MSVAEMVWVERDAERGVDASSTSSRQAIEERLNSPKRWQSIVVFPEGKAPPGLLALLLIDTMYIYFCTVNIQVPSDDAGVLA